MEEASVNGVYHEGRLLKKFWGRCISDVWDYFRFEVYEDGTYVDKKYTICLLCGSEMKYCGNTTNMSNHLDRKHPGCRETKKPNGKLCIGYRAIKQEEGTKDILSNLVDAYAEDQTTCSVQVRDSATKVSESKHEADDTTVRIYKSFWEESSDSVWDYFKFEVDENGQYLDVTRVQCTLCEVQLDYRGNSTANLASHLDSAHPETRTVQVKQEKEEVTVSKEEEMVKSLVAQCSKEIEENVNRPEVTSTGNGTKKGRHFKGFWGNATSIVWKHFRFEADEDGNYVDKSTLYCMLCDTKLKYCHNTTNMAHHLERRHNVIRFTPTRRYIGIETCRDLIEIIPSPSAPKRVGALHSKQSCMNIKSNTINTKSVSNSSHTSTVTLSNPSHTKTLSLQPKAPVHTPSVFMKSLTQKRFQEEGDIVIDDSTQYKSFWGLATSPVWKYFLFEVDKDGKYVDKVTTYCTLCGLRMGYFQTTSNLAQHLRRKHFEEYFSSDLPEELHDGTEIPASAKSAKPKCDDHKAERIASAIAKHFITDLRPFSDLELKTFQEMCEVMCPEYTVPEKTHFKNEICTRLYNNKKEKVLTEMSSAFRHCISIDWWKSNAKQNYATLTVHFLDEFWDLQNRTLKTFLMKDRPTPQELASKLSDLATEWKVKNPVILTNNTYIMKAAATNVLHWPCIPALDYTVDMAVFKALSLPDVDHFLSQIRNLFHQLHQVAHCVQIKQKQDMMCLPEKDLFREFGDHWTSTLEMLVLFTEQEQVFKSVVIDCRLSEYLLLSGTSLTKVRELIQILQVLKTATAYLTPERRHTLSVIMPVIIKLKGCLCKHSQDNEFVLTVKQTMLEVIEDSYGTETAQMLMKTACALDPRMKKLAFLKEAERDEVRRKLSQEAISLAMAAASAKKEEFISLTDSDDGEPAAKVSRTDDDVSISDWLGDIVSVRGTSSPTIAQQVDNELKLFITEQDITFDDSPLQWWQKRCQMYTLLSPVAKKYMCISAIGVETANSRIRGKRVALDSDTVDMQLFLNLNS